MVFEYCTECREINYAPTSKNGVFDKRGDSIVNDHANHKTIIFDGDINRFTPPIRNVLNKLYKDLPVSNNEIVFFRMAVDLDSVYQDNKENEKYRASLQARNQSSNTK